MSDVSVARTKNESLYKNAEILETMFKQQSLAGVVRSVNKLKNDLTLKESQLQRIFDTIGTDDFGSGIQMIEGFMRNESKARVTIFQKYNLDTSVFENRISPKWDTDGGSGFDWEVYQTFTKKTAHQRKMVFQAASYMLELVEAEAKKAGYDYENTREAILSWHEEMLEKFDELTAREFWQEYMGDRINVDLRPKTKEKQYSLVEFKKFCEPYYPALLLSEAFEDEKQIGTIGETQAEGWDKEYTNAVRAKNVEETNYLLRRLAARVMSIVIYRCTYGPDALWPNLDEENLLVQLATLPEDQAQTVGFEIQDSTQLDELTSTFIQRLAEVD